MSARPLCPVPSSLSPCPPTHSSHGLAAIAALIGNGGLIMGSVFAVFAPCIALVFPHLLKAHGTEARVRKAAARFRGIPWSALEEKHLCASRATPEEAAALSKATLPAELGDVDAFLSHSWSDDGHAKYAALSEWADDFTERNGRPPLLWFDKACIDQNDIENALVGLPVYVSGCHVLLILDGPTYPTRLWCIMEIFCFLTMGGNREDIVVLPVEASSPLEVPDSAGSLGSPLVCLAFRRWAEYSFRQTRSTKDAPTDKGQARETQLAESQGEPSDKQELRVRSPESLADSPEGSIMSTTRHRSLHLGTPFAFAVPAVLRRVARQASEVAGSFRLANARCFDERDRERLVTAIEAAYGEGSAPFDQAPN